MRGIILRFCSVYFLSYSFIASATTQFIYEDEFGNKVFSDKAPPSGEYKEVATKLITTIQWEPTKKTKAKPKSKKKSKKQPSKQRTSKQQLCESLVSKIQSNQLKLASRLDAEDFDKTKKQLSDARWEHRKRC